MSCVTEKNPMRLSRHVFILFLALCLMADLAQAFGKASPLFVKIKDFVFSYIGATGAVASSGWQTNLSSAISTIDGGFNSPQRMAVDSAHDRMYVVDTQNFRIQKFILSTGAFVGAIGNSTANGTCIAGKQNGWCTGGSFSTGTTDGTFNGSETIAIDSANDFMYVTSSVKLQKFILSTGAYVGSVGYTSGASGTCSSGVQSTWCTGGTFTGSGVDGGFSYAAGVAIDTVNSFIFVGDSGAGKIAKMNLSTGAFIGAIGYSNASTGTCANPGIQTAWCTGGTFDTSTSLEGSFNTLVTLDIDVASDVLLVADSWTYTIQKFVLSTGAYVGSIGDSLTSTGTCISGKQNSWCTGGAFFFGSQDGQFWIQGSLTIDSANNAFYVSEMISQKIQKFNLSTGAFVGSIGKSGGFGTCVPGAQPAWCTGGFFTSDSIDGGFNSPSGLAIDSTNHLYITDSSNNRVQKFTASTGAFIATIGAVATPLGSWTAYTGLQTATSKIDGGFSNVAGGIAIDQSGGFFYVGDSARISKFNLSTGAFVGSIGRSTASGTCALGAQSTWCTGGNFTVSTGDGLLSTLRSIAIDKNNNFLYAITGQYIQQFNLSTGAFIGAIGRSTASGTCVAGAQSSWCTGGSFSTGTGDGMFSSPYALAVIPSSGDILVLDSSNYRVQKFSKTGTFIGAIGKSTASGTCVAGAQSSWCTGGSFSSGAADGMFAQTGSIAIDEASGHFYVFDTGNARIQKFNLTTGAQIGAIGNSTASGTCRAGRQTAWCTGGNFSYAANTDGAFTGGNAIIAVDPITNQLISAEPARIQKFSLSGGGFVGSIGLNSTPSGSCGAGKQLRWCSNGVFTYGSTDGAFNALYGAAISGRYIYMNDSNNFRVIRLAF